LNGAAAKTPAINNTSLSAGKIFSFFGTFWVAKKDAHWLSIPITKSEPGLLEYEPS
jgi:hypothetical protein